MKAAKRCEAAGERAAREGQDAGPCGFPPYRGMGRLSRRKRPALLLFVSAAIFFAELPEVARGGSWKVNGGVLRVGAVVKADQVRVGVDGVLAGQGRIEAEVLVSGLVSPGGGGGASIATLSVIGKLQFMPPGRYVCDVAFTPSVADVLSVNGQVLGIGGVVVNQAFGAVPWQTLIVAGGAGSDFSGFTIDPGGSLHCVLQVAGAHLMLTDVVADSDFDGMPDYWEHDHFGHPTAAGPDDDSDGDGQTNAQEFRAGTHPKDPGSCLRWLRIAAVEDGSLALTWSSAEGRFYRVTCSWDGWGGFTALVKGVPATPPNNSVTSRLDSARQAFYRIELE